MATTINFNLDNFDNADSSFQGLGIATSSNPIGNIPGCMCDPATYPTGCVNFNPIANVDDGSCIAKIPGCMDPAAINYDPTANSSDGSCIILGCTDPAYTQYNPSANTDDGTCATLISYGCTDTSTSTIGDSTGYAYPNYINGGSFTNPCDDTNGTGCIGGQTGINCCCEASIIGCTDQLANNFVPTANLQPQVGSTLECAYTIYGCTDSLATNYNVNATVDDGTCAYAQTNGCTNPDATNYDPSFTVDDGTCEWHGCAYLNLNYGPNEHVPWGATANYTISNTTGVVLQNLWSNTTTPAEWLGTPIIINTNFFDDESCAFVGCSDPAATNYNPPSAHPSWPGAGITDDGSCVYAVLGCTDATANNYDPAANQDDGSCTYNMGCTDLNAFNYDATAVQDDGSCYYNPGCTDPISPNYDPSYDFDDGSCIYIYGCTDSSCTNYDSTANIDDGSCTCFCHTCGTANSIDTTPGCCDNTQFNYDPTATCNDQSCIPWIAGCMYGGALIGDTTWWASSPYAGLPQPTVAADNYNPNTNIYDDGSCLWPGCTDPVATNYDNTANLLDGACFYEMNLGDTTDPDGNPLGGTVVFIIPDTDPRWTPHRVQGYVMDDVSGNAPFKPFGCYGTFVGGAVSATPQSVWTPQAPLPNVPATGGLETTDMLFSNCPAEAGAAFTDAQGTINQQDNWFIPTTAEWQEIHDAGYYTGVGRHHASHEISAYRVWAWNNSNATQDNVSKLTGGNIRTVYIRGFSFGTITPTILGCYDPSALNYNCATDTNPNSTTPCNDGVTQDDGTCVY